MPDTSTPVARYCDAGGATHEVHVRRTAHGAWEVLDTTLTHTTLVETLTGFDEGRPAAEALARDYAQQQHAPRGTAIGAASPPERSEASAARSRT